MNAISLHKKLEENAALLIFGILFVSSIGGFVQVLPSLFQQSLSTASANTRVYDAVELTGRDIYVREGCHVCHSQQIRPLLGDGRSRISAKIAPSLSNRIPAPSQAAADCQRVRKYVRRQTPG